MPSNYEHDMKEEITKRAMELFARFGVRSVTMDEIARDLSISKKTIYQYFKDKDEIVTSTTKMHMEMEKQEYQEIADSSQNAIEELSQANKCMRKDFREINPSLLFDLQKYHRKAWESWLDFKVFIRESITSNLKRGIDEGFFRKGIDVEALAIMRVEQVQIAFDDRVFPRDKFDFRELQMLLFDHFVHGILTDEGRSLYETYLKQQLVQE